MTGRAGLAGRLRPAGLAHRASRAGVRALRRVGFWPRGVPDRNGDDDRLAGGSLAQTVMVYFPGTMEDVYQLRQWYGPFRALNQRHPVVVVMQDSRTARTVRAELGLPVVTIARYAVLDDLLARSEVKLALYVGHNPLNFIALRFTSMAHVFLNHGDSDKGVAVSNQNKAYDFLFVPGQAAVDRLQSYLMRFDAVDRCLTIGRPQLDDEPAARLRAGGLPAVLYAPTWEGAQPSVAYGSVLSHGPALVRSLLSDGRFAVVYRPHPLTGVTDAAYGDADAEIRRLVTDAAAGRPTAGHRVDADPSVAGVLAATDLLVCDVSAVVMDWLPSGKPLVVTVPVAEAAVVVRSRLLDTLPRLAAADAARAAEVVATEVDADPGRADRLALVDYYLGDTSPGAATARFVDACTTVIGIRDRDWSAITARGPALP